MAAPKSRKELVALLEAVNEQNRQYFSKFGTWQSPQIKVFWVEVSAGKQKQVLEASGATATDKDLYSIVEGEDAFWIDTADGRVWQIYTLADRKKGARVVRTRLTSSVGADQLWLTENFMKRVQKTNGYDDRGFGIKFKDELAESEPTSDFSAKFWIGRSTSQRQEGFLKAAKDHFSISSIRFGRNESRDENRLTGQLFELYFGGHMTVNTCDDTDEMFELFKGLRGAYRQDVEFLESTRRRKPVTVELRFADEVPLEGFEGVAHGGTGNLKLWLQKTQGEDGMARFSGVDLHTGDFVNVDLAQDYSYVSTPKEACMNVAPRLGTLAARYMSTKVTIFHEGVELFA